MLRHQASSSCSSVLLNQLARRSVPAYSSWLVNGSDALQHHNSIANAKRHYFKSTMPSSSLFDVFSKIKNVITGPEFTNTYATKQKKEDVKPTTREAPKAQEDAPKTAADSVDQEKQANDDLEFNKMLDAGKYDLNDFRIYIAKSVEPAVKAGQITDQVKEFQSYIKILDAMTDEERANPKIFQKYAFKIKQRINQDAGTTPQQFTAMFDTFNNARQIFEVMSRFKKQGKPIPKKAVEIQKFFKDNKDDVRKEMEKIRKERAKM
ncbi:hypothetical protein SAMD00019534_108140 [Acytostelium subglobosum LB1]|uniref:hypothetical protein n=1 Tax=Acytostelium subglobosum LB1 TaxID=1410327 RepID=UPI000644CE8A|nr:hypothetical protein SAMD00019534_108140 [Acytostelium subglobosum LB1]GAM27638.1 hypothetical protein SAMD00019534_108140 [Acytostelium subglobosum LB1]|eukprot:XP_012749297.1 hypothetical protein SAMD00019534_108140 [Acytostelium subglobosum LB1]